MNKEVELKVLGIYESPAESEAYVMLLEEIGGKVNRKLPIVIGRAEALSIRSIMNKLVNTRPNTHDLMQACFSFFKGSVLKAVIYKVVNGIYYSYIYLNKEDEFTRIDARTSDAVAMALKFDVPIFVEQQILESESIETIATEPSAKRRDHAAVTQKEHFNRETLQVQLNKAIEEENYELASILRDKIAELD